MSFSSGATLARTGRHKRTSRSGGGRWFLLPGLVFNTLIIVLPAVVTIAVSFMSWDGIGEATWFGLGNFEALAGDPVFWSSLGNNVIWSALFLTIPVAGGLLVAALMLTIRRGRTLLQVIFFLPVVLASAISGRIWQGMIYSPVSGLFGWLTRHGLTVPDPLANPATALFGVAFVDMWHWWGFLAVIFFAAMRQVSQDLIEAAQLDGAGFARIMRHIVLPGIGSTIVLMLIMTVIWSFTVFDFVYILTQGGPAFGSEVLSTLAYRYAFYEFDVGKAAAASCVMSALGLGATVAYVRYQRTETA